MIGKIIHEISYSAKNISLGKSSILELVSELSYELGSYAYIRINSKVEFRVQTNYKPANG